jgi:PAS domain S-box-containing protein
MISDEIKTKEQLLEELEEMRRRVVALEAKHRQADELILQSIHNWEDTFDNITDSITIHDKNFNIIYANKAAEDMLNLPFMKMTKKKCYKFYHGKDTPPEGCPSCDCLKTGEDVSFEMFEPHLNRFIEIRAMPQFDSKKQLIGLIHIVRDISERKQMEEALKRAYDEMELRVHERTAELLKANEEMMNEIAERKRVEKALQSSEGRFKKLSQEFNVLLDAIPDNIILLSSDLEIMWANKAAALEFGSDDFSAKGRYCDTLCSSFPSDKESCPTMKSFITGKEESAQISTPGGRFLDVRVFPIKDETGNVKSVMEVARDISSKVRMEKETKLMQAKLIHTNKMTSLGTLVSGVAHEINNPNTFIKSNAQLLSRIWSHAGPYLEKYRSNNADIHLGGFSYSELIDLIPKLLKDLDEGSLRIQSIVDNLRNFARPEKASLEGKLNINNVVSACTSMLSNQINKYTSNFHFSEGDNIPPAKGSSQQIEQVVMNLIMNALQSLKSTDQGVTVETSHNKKTNSAVIKIRDEGIGMSKDILERITEPFFTTKLDSGGTGLGLSISYAIIEEHNGSLEFESEPERGTTATITLPFYDDE